MLRPGGRLAPFHHVFQAPPEVTEALAEACGRVSPDSPAPARWVSLRPPEQALDAYQPMFAKIAGGIREAGGFGEPEQWRFGWQRTCTRDEWLDELPTHGRLNLFPQDKLAKVLEGVGAAIDAMGGSFTMPYTTVAVTAARTTPA